MLGDYQPVETTKNILSLYTDLIYVNTGLVRKKRAGVWSPHSKIKYGVWSEQKLSLTVMLVLLKFVLMLEFSLLTIISCACYCFLMKLIKKNTTYINS